jgi:hypothetical protein
MPVCCVVCGGVHVLVRVLVCVPVLVLACVRVWGRFVSVGLLGFQPA